MNRFKPWYRAKSHQRSAELSRTYNISISRWLSSIVDTQVIHGPFEGLGFLSCRQSLTHRKALVAIDHTLVNPLGLGSMAKEGLPLI